MNLGLDVDGVLYPWHMLIYNYVKMFPGTDDTYDEFWKNIVQHRKYNQTFVKNLINMDDMYNKMSADKSIVESIKKLDSGNSIYYITAVPDRIKRVREAWLIINDFPQAGNLITAFDKEYYIRDLEIDIMVEDRADNIEAFSKLTRTIGVRQPWNEHIQNNGFEFIDHITQLPEYLGVE